jgi:hypothetical protein
MSATKGFHRIAISGIILLAVATAGFFIGRFGGSSFENPAFASLPMFDNASRGKSLSMATGPVEEGIEALYTLDHLTGDLHCWLLNSHTGAVAASFQASAAEALGVVGEGDYVMTTGLMDFVGIEGAVRPSWSAVYVGDGNTGKVVGYVLMYNRGAIQRGEVGPGELRLISEMVTRAANIQRDQGK